MNNEQIIDTEDLSRELVVEILRYLVAHPKAKDTASGIEKWWLPGSGRKAGSVQESLNALVANGWVIERSSAQSARIYSLNENAITQIEDFLASATPNVGAKED